MPTPRKTTPKPRSSRRSALHWVLSFGSSWSSHFWCRSACAELPSFAGRFGSREHLVPIPVTVRLGLCTMGKESGAQLNCGNWVTCNWWGAYIINLKYVCIADNHLKKVVERLGLSFHNARELNHIIDEEMPGWPKFKHEEISLGGESFDFHFQDVISCIRTLFGDPNFARSLQLVPERHYLDAAHTTRIFSEMHTGKWWWSVQVLQNNAACILLCAHCF